MKHLRRNILAQLTRGLLAGGIALLALAGGTAHAQAYPSKTVTIVVSYPPGGDTDALARVFAEKLALKFGQPVVVENKPGASGTIGNAFVAKAAADGHTLLFTPNTISTATLVLKAGTGVQYDVLNDFTPVFLAGSQSLFLVVNTGAGVKNVGELVAAAKADKIKTYGSPGSGSPMHILGAMFNKSAGVDIKQVPYRGSGPAVVDLLGGHIPFMYTTLGPVAQHIASGKLAVLAVADPQRSSLAPTVPTLQELGYKDSDVGAWQGFLGPKGMPADVVATLNRHFNDILKTPEVQDRVAKIYLVPTGGEAAAIGRINAADHVKYGKVIKDLGIQAD